MNTNVPNARVHPPMDRYSSERLMNNQNSTSLSIMYLLLPRGMKPIIILTWFLYEKVKSWMAKSPRRQSPITWMWRQLSLLQLGNRPPLACGANYHYCSWPIDRHLHVAPIITTAVSQSTATCMWRQLSLLQLANRPPLGCGANCHYCSWPIDRHFHVVPIVTTAVCK